MGGVTVEDVRYDYITFPVAIGVTIIVLLGMALQYYYWQVTKRYAGLHGDAGYTALAGNTNQ